MQHCRSRRYAARDRLAILFGHLAGLRAKEIAAVQKRHVLAEDGNVRESFLLIAEETKGKKARRVFLSKKLQNEIVEYLKSTKLREISPCLIQSQKGNAFSANTMCQLLCQIYKECGIEGASSHSGRRSFITKLAAKGVGVRVLAELAAHSTIATTQRYIDVNENQLRNAVELV